MKVKTKDAKGTKIGNKRGFAVRFSPAEFEIVKRAALLAGQSLSRYSSRAALNKAVKA